MSDYNDELQMMPIRSRSRNDVVSRGASGTSGGGQNGSRGSNNGNGSRKRRKKRRKPVFYKILLLSFLAGLVVIAIVLKIGFKIFLGKTIGRGIFQHFRRRSGKDLKGRGASRLG